MISHDELRAWSGPAGEGLAYFRPMICKKTVAPGCIFLVGINPATPVTPDDLDVDTYAGLLLDYDRFLAYYRQRRIDARKTALSRTRTGMHSFIQWLAKAVPDPIVETNVIPYPTPRTKDLKKVPDWVKSQAREIFVQLLQRVQPRLLLLHGKDTVTETAELLRNHRIANVHVDPRADIRALEDQPTLFRFEWPGGGDCKALACRHFMYYGESGSSFAGFRGNVLRAAA